MQSFGRDFPPASEGLQASDKGVSALIGQLRIGNWRGSLRRRFLVEPSLEKPLIRALRAATCRLSLDHRQKPCSCKKWAEYGDSYQKFRNTGFTAFSLIYLPH